MPHKRVVVQCIGCKREFSFRRAEGVEYCLCGHCRKVQPDRREEMAQIAKPGKLLSIEIRGGDELFRFRDLTDDEAALERARTLLRLGKKQTAAWKSVS